MTDLVDDVEIFIRSDMLGRMGTDPSGELASMTLASLMIAFANWRGRFPSPVPRVVELSQELETGADFSRYRADVEAIAEDCRAGNPLDRYLSEGVSVSYVPTNVRPTENHLRTDLDGLLAEWGVHHLHLSTILKSNGFVDRTDDLLFVAFRGNTAYFIDIYPHDTQSWSDRDVLRTAVRNWPDASIIFPLRGAIGLAQDPTDDEYKAIRNAGVTTMLQIDGTVYVPLGQTTAGTPGHATQYSNTAMYALRAFRAALSDNPTLLDDLLVENGMDIGGGSTWSPSVHDDAYGVMGSTANDPEQRVFHRLAALLS